jgi:hypothetical protein
VPLMVLDFGLLVQGCRTRENMLGRVASSFPSLRCVRIVRTTSSGLGHFPIGGKWVLVKTVESREQLVVLPSLSYELFAAVGQRWILLPAFWYVSVDVLLFNLDEFGFDHSKLSQKESSQTQAH